MIAAEAGDKLIDILYGTFFQQWRAKMELNTESVDLLVHPRVMIKNQPVSKKDASMAVIVLKAWCWKMDDAYQSINARVTMAQRFIILVKLWNKAATHGESSELL